VLRLAMAGLIIAAIVTQLTRTDRVVNFLSFFTIESNVLVAAALIWGASRPAGSVHARHYESFRSAVTLFIALVGVVFALLLADVSRDLGLTLPWVNSVLHYVSPVALAIDFLLVAPVARLRWASMWPWLAFPLAYMVYSLIRGGIVDWYPYPFFDHRSIGWDGVAKHCIGMAVGIIATAPGIIAINRASFRRGPDEPLR
jgi:hypothetical protein